MKEPIIVRDGQNSPDFALLRPPVFDANGTKVELPADFKITPEFRAFMAGRLPAPNCPHYMPAADIRHGFTTCERCGRGRTA